MESSSASSSHDPLMRLSCYECRVRKLKCDRLNPECSRCSATGIKCQYPASRKRPVITATRPRVKELQSRLEELELRLKATQEEGYQSSTPFGAFGSELSETGRFEELPSQDVIEELTNIFFTKVPCEGLMIHPSRYLASLYLPPHMQPPMCLQYIIMARAAFVSPDHKHLAEPFYLRARCYLEADEQKGEGEYFISLAHAQCCILLSHFEVRNLWFSRSSMSTSKAVRLSQILGLHQLDNHDTSNRSMTLPPPKDWCEQEERRRTLWAIYCGDKNTSGTTGWPSLMDVKRISALVPASEEAFQLGIEEPSVTLSHLLNGDKIFRASPFACRIIAAHLFHECLERTYQDIQEPDPDPADIHNGDFYKHHDVLDPGLTTAYVTLPDTLHTSQHSQEAITTSLQRHTASIFIHRIGSAQAKKHNIPVEILAGTRARLPPAADAIFDIIASLADVSTMFRNPVVSFAAYVAAYVFLEDYTNTQNRDSEMKVTGITDLMITIGHEDPVTAAGAVQLAFQLRKHGIDPSAVNKIQGLMAKMGLKGPVMGWHKYEEEVVFCPFEVPWGPAPPVLRSENTRTDLGGMS